MILRSLSNQKGLSLLMLVMVLAALAVSVTTAYLSINPAIMTGQDKDTESKIELIKMGLYKYKTQHAGVFPASLDDLTTPNNPACAADTNAASPTYRTLQGWCGPYVDQLTQQSPTAFKTDGWGSILQYNGVVIRSCGPNRTCGDADDLVKNL